MDSNEKLYPFADAERLIQEKRVSLSLKRGYLSLLRSVAVMLIIVAGAFSLIFRVDIASGAGMYPAVLDGDVAVGYRIGQNYLKNDVVVCEIGGKKIIGRVVASGGDSVNITEEGVLFVNGTEQKGEIAFPTYPKEDIYPYTVPEGCLYILGDNRTQTKDSRDFGAVDVKSVKGKVIGIFRKRGI